jgi:hypothetical protein
MYILLSVWWIKLFHNVFHTVIFLFEIVMWENLYLIKLYNSGTLKVLQQLLMLIFGTYKQTAKWGRRIYTSLSLGMIYTETE